MRYAGIERMATECLQHPEAEEAVSKSPKSETIPGNEKGRLSEQEKKVESSDEFVRARRKHPAVESCINLQDL